MPQNYYEMLGIARDASPEQIKMAYRKLARKYHPDVSQERDAEEKIRELNVAYALLSQIEQRQHYDWELTQAETDLCITRAVVNTQDFFTQFFEDYSQYRSTADITFTSTSDHNFQQHAGAHPIPVRGEDHYVNLAVPVEVAFHGTCQQIHVAIPYRHILGQHFFLDKTLNIQIPPGICQGQQICLTGQGQPGQFGGPAGDLYLNLHYETSADIKIEGADIYYHIDISPWEAALGQDIELHTPAGRLNVHIPKNTVYGHQLYIPDKGIPATPPGHLYLVLNIVYPKAETERKLSATPYEAQTFSHFNPRAKGEHL